jgi:plastocyanin
MRRALLLCSVVLVGALIGTASSVAGTATPVNSAVQASGSEYRIALSRSSIRQGRVRLEFVNYGEDVHDLAIRRIGSKRQSNVGETRPGDRRVGRYRVRRGTYLLWCTISDHRARGMRATLKVRR